jgi:DNA-binding transcriptional MerR regulator
VDFLSIGDFSRITFLSPKALRLYDKKGILQPTYVDLSSSYRFYDTYQARRGLLISVLRELDMPLTKIKEIVNLDPHEAAEEVSLFWDKEESRHINRRAIAHDLAECLNGQRASVSRILTREISQRTLICLSGNVKDDHEFQQLAKHFFSKLKSVTFEKPQDATKAAFAVFYRSVSRTITGPVELCQPLPHSQAVYLANRLSGFTCKEEPAHREEYVHLDSGVFSTTEWKTIVDDLRSRAFDLGLCPDDVGIRHIYLSDSAKDCFVPSEFEHDIAVPLTAS